MLELGLLVVGAFLFFLALFMLFRQLSEDHKLLGMVALVSIVPLIIYSLIKFGQPASRKAFYILVVGFLSMLVGVSGGGLAKLPFLPEHEVVQTIEEKIAPAKDTPLPNEEAAQAVQLPDADNYDPVLSGSEFETIETEDIIPSPQEVPRPAAPVIKYQTLEPSQLQFAINKLIKLDMKNGEVIEGTLTHVNKESIVVESNVSGGSLGLSHALSDIQTISVQGQLDIPETIDSDLTDTSDINETVQPAASEVVNDVISAGEEAISEAISETEEINVETP